MIDEHLYEKHEKKNRIDWRTWRIELIGSRFLFTFFMVLGCVSS